MESDLFDGIVSVSGDGLLHEIVNGLLKRKDWDQIKDTLTLGAIPGGTGNGLIKSLLSIEGEQYGVEEAAWLIIRGRRSLIDLTRLKMEYEPHFVYSFLSVAWSVIADIDLNSEVCRCLGPLRFDLWGAWRVMSLLECRGSLCFKDVQQIANRNEVEHLLTDPLVNPLLNRVEYNQHDFTFFYAMNMPFAASKIQSAPLSRPDDGVNDIITSRRQQGAGRSSLLNLLLAIESGDYFD